MSVPRTDDLEAVRAVVEALTDFKPDEQQRIFRWAAEKLGMPTPFGPAAHHLPPAAPAPHAPVGAPPPLHLPPSGTDIKSFIAAKKPRSDVQFAATMAYYYRFEAPEAERKDSVNKDDLQEAARKANRDRFANPLKTLQNAHQLGLLDKGTEKATFTINSVGENLVAMTLPGDGSSSVKPKKPKKKSAKKAAAKKTAKKA